MPGVCTDQLKFKENKIKWINMNNSFLCLKNKPLIVISLLKPVVYAD